MDKKEMLYIKTACICKFPSQKDSIKIHSTDSFTHSIELDLSGTNILYRNIQLTNSHFAFSREVLPPIMIQ